MTGLYRYDVDSDDDSFEFKTRKSHSNSDMSPEVEFSMAMVTLEDILVEDNSDPESVIALLERANVLREALGEYALKQLADMDRFNMISGLLKEKFGLAKPVAKKKKRILRKCLDSSDSDSDDPVDSGSRNIGREDARVEVGATRVTRSGRRVERRGYVEERKRKRVREITGEERGDRLEVMMEETEKCITTVHEEVVKQVGEDEFVLPEFPGGLKLKDYQALGVKWMLSLHNLKRNCILADEMGLGKTVQTAAFIRSLCSQLEGGYHLIVAPLSTLKHWEKTCKQWIVHSGVKTWFYHDSKELRLDMFDDLYSTLEDGSQSTNIVITTYEICLRDASQLECFDWDTLVVDEAHRLKNAQSKLFTVLAGFSCKFRLLLTGTPLQNNLDELWSLLNFILPDIFGSQDAFSDWFASPFIEGDSAIAEVELRDEEQLIVMQRLHAVMKPFLLRRVKEDVMSELPKKEEWLVSCPLSGPQRELYLYIQQSSRENATSMQFNNVMVQLRKTSNHPLLFREYLEDSQVYEGLQDVVGLSGKFWMMDQILARLKTLGSRVLVFFQWTKTMDLFESYLSLKKQRHYRDYMRLDGGTCSSDRIAMIDKFNEDDSPLFMFLLSTRAGGLGINLQTADTVIMFDTDWNPQSDNQAHARAHRIGQKKDVRVLRLITKGTVEESVLNRAIDKLAMESKVLGADFSLGSKTRTQSKSETLSTEDLLTAPDWSIDDGENVIIERLTDILARTPEERQLLDAAADEYVSLTPLNMDRRIPNWFSEQVAKKKQRSASVVLIDDPEAMVRAMNKHKRHKSVESPQEELWERVDDFEESIDLTRD